MKKPLFVALSDIHFNLNNLEVASAALRAAISKAEDLDAPLVIAGDLNDTKAIIRAEVANRLLDIFKYSKEKPYLLIGNHDLINEKGKEHSLNFLRSYVNIVDKLTNVSTSTYNFWMIPYQAESDKLKGLLDLVSPAALVIMHQGFLGAAMGEYIQDKSSISPDEVKDFTVITGHYHKHQTIGTVTYIGSPYTTSFAEAKDGPKGILVVYDDHSFEHVELGLRRHHVIETSFDKLGQIEAVSGHDFVRLKITGTKDELDSIDKNAVFTAIGSPTVFKLDKIYNEIPKLENVDKKLPASELFDKIIDNMPGTDPVYLKQLWRDVNENSSK